jgi:hypothetical protein
MRDDGFGFRFAFAARARPAARLAFFARAVRSAAVIVSGERFFLTFPP